MSKELIPCPFCQKEKAILLTTKNSIFEPFVEEGIAYHVMCTECGASTRKCYTKEQAIELWNRRPSVWHTGTPTEDGMYICKVFYGDVQNDIRILEWVGAMDCFCLPNSDTRIYHFYVGENGGKEPEVVYEWLKLDLRFRMEKDIEWMDPIPIHLNSSIRGTLEDCLKAAKKYGWS